MKTSSILKYLGCFFLALIVSLNVHFASAHGQDPLLSGASQISGALQTSGAPQNLMHQGRDALQQEQFTQAISLFDQAVQMYADSGAPLNHALSLSYRAIAHHEIGHQSQAESDIQSSINLLPEDPEDTNENQVFAQVFNTYGELQFAWGQLDAAVDSWQNAADAYQSLNDSIGIIGTELNQLQALRALGYYRQAKRRTEAVEQQLHELSDPTLLSMAWRSLGNTQFAVGEYDNASKSLERSLDITQNLNSPRERAATLLSLGNLERARGDRQLNQYLLETRQSLVRQSYCPDWTSDEINNVIRDHYIKAIHYYDEVLQNNSSLPLQVRSKLNTLSLSLIWGEQPTHDDVERLYTTLKELPLGRFSIYATTRFAQDIRCLPSHHFETNDDSSEFSIQILNDAVRAADELGDIRAKSLALGALGRVYEEIAEEIYVENDGRDSIESTSLNEKAFEEAIANTKEAMQFAQQIQGADITYQWQWQMGRLLKAKGNLKEAVDYYSTAFDNLQTLRSDIVVLDTNIQFSFRERIEPLYRQFAELLLEPSPPFSGEPPTVDQSEQRTEEQRAKNLKKARSVLEALQLAELDNFFRDACSDIEPESLDTIIDEQNRTSAVLYTIILPDRLDLVLKLPSLEGRDTTLTTGSSELIHSNLRYYSTAVSSEEVRETVLDFRRELIRPDTIKTVKTPAQQVYDWLIQPIEADLDSNGINHIVFVLDGVLRNIPMGALYNGDHYLIEDYAVSLSPGLQLVQSDELTLESTNLLTAGISESIDNFPALPNVQLELEAIASTFPTATQLLNQQFTKEEFGTKLSQNPISIVHLATHGQFSSQVDDTFILAYDNTINVNELSDILRSHQGAQSNRSIDLLVLSACQTASGDDRAALGLAGVAVRAGARSTLASLWSVDDEATALLVSEFYKQLYNLGEGQSKVEALKQAQQYLKNFDIQGYRPYRHPRYWSAFVLLGNWM